MGQQVRELQAQPAQDGPMDPFDPVDAQQVVIAYARILYDENGLAPWSASQHCWK